MLCVFRTVQDNNRCHHPTGGNYMNIYFDEVPEFSNDLRKLKKFRKLPDNIETFKNALATKIPDGLPGTVRISRLGKNVKLPVYKVKNFHCSDLKGKGSRSGIRIIYTFIQKENRIVFIQIYFKGDNEDDHDKERILKYCDSQSEYYILRADNF